MSPTTFVTLHQCDDDPDCDDQSDEAGCGTNRLFRMAQRMVWEAESYFIWEISHANNTEQRGRKLFDVMEESKNAAEAFLGRNV